MPTVQPPVFGVPERAARVRFRRALTLMVMTLVLPGSAQLVAGNKAVGRVALRIWGALLVIVLAVGLVAAISLPTVLGWASTPWLLGVARWALIAGAIGWACLFFDAWRLGEPLSLLQNHRLAMTGFNSMLCFSVAGALLFSAHVVGVQQHLMSSMFGSGDAVGAHDGRYNVLLLGGDSGAGRWGLRPDSITVASIDAQTGKTVLVGLPRNMANFKFRDGTVMDQQFPQGFDCDGCYLNGVSTWAQDHIELFKHPNRAGTDATIMAVEGITGLRINYWAMVNLQGFKDLVDAVGGVELTVRDRIPVGGLGDDVTGYIEPGTRVLNGHDTLWFARAREGSDDYSRMARQKCVMNAMLQQISPQTVLTRFQEIAAAGSAMVSTNLPQKEVGRFMSLALKAKSQPMSTVSLVPPRINTADPDEAEIHQLIDTAIGRSDGSIKPPAKKPGKAKPSGTLTGGSKGSLRDGYQANQADDLASAC